MSIPAGEVAIVGAGPTGTLLAILLERRGFQVALYEARSDPRQVAADSGRSINLALSDRGIHALRCAGVFDDVAAMLMPMRGRQIHPLGGVESLQLYGQRPDEVIYAVSRHRLTQVLLDAAAQHRAIDIKFEHRMEDADFSTAAAVFRNLRTGRILRVPMTPLLAADGAGSTMRRLMSEARLIDAREDDLEHGYKELSIPADADGHHRMAPDALHIWPRGNYMLIALPNLDGSFTATLFLPKQGQVSFDALDSPRVIDEFVAENFPDIRPLMPDFAMEFQAHPTGFLGTVRAHPWSAAATAVLIGDAAHAIVPFHGQGMNCCFEDCIEFEASIARSTAWQQAFAKFYASRKRNADAIATMALENYLEMRERVIDDKFRLQQTLALELERRFPERFIPRYSMVMFHHEISYHSAERRGTLQAQLLAELTATASSLAEIDFAHAERMIRTKLDPLARNGST